MGLILPLSKRSAWKWGAVLLPFVLVGCSNSSNTATLTPKEDVGQPEITINEVPIPTTSDKTKFASKDYGVAGSPRVTTSKGVRKGGGTYKIGKPYTIRGKRYVPKDDPNYSKTGLASWYGPNFHGRLTANGEVYDQYSLSAAHPTMPLPSYAKVTNLENGSSLTVRVNDRGPYAHNRIIDLSAQAARLLGYTKKGVAKVRVEYVGRARMDGLDGEMLMASYDPGSLDPSLAPNNRGPKVLLAKIGEKLGIANSRRTSLQAYSQTGFSAPVPQFRPLTNNGYPIQISSLDQPRRFTLVNGYFIEANLRGTSAAAIEKITNATSQIEVQGPEQSQFDIKRLIVGPLVNGNHLINLEAKLLKWGPASIVMTENNTSGAIHTMVAEENVEEVIRLLQKENVIEFQFIN